MKISTITVGPIQSNCYIAWDEESPDAIVIDPGDEAGRIVRKIEENRLRVGLIVCTHAHFDHVGAVADVREKTGAKVAINRNDLELFMHAKHQAGNLGV